MTVFQRADASLTDRLDHQLAEVERRLLAAVAQADRLADDASRHLVAAGGKRLRPALTLLTAQLGDPTPPQILEAAVAVELTHLASLYHDDVMDSAAVRRGVPAAHEVWGNTVAILTGDLLFARASSTVADLGADAIKLHAATFERLCLGQMAETVGPESDVDPIDHYLKVLADKTGSLVGTSARYGAMFAGCAPELVDVMQEFGERIGVAFQVADDYIDLVSDGDVTGKTPGTDLREGVPTMPVLLLRRRVAREGADPADTELLSRIDGDLSDDAALAGVVEALRQHPVVQETHQAAVTLASEAIDLLAPLEQGPVKDALVAFARMLVDRVA
jgi:heptaprenyl diphosphate synthase